MGGEEEGRAEVGMAGAAEGKAAQSQSLTHGQRVFQQQEGGASRVKCEKQRVKVWSGGAVEVWWLGVFRGAFFRNLRKGRSAGCGWLNSRSSPSGGHTLGG